MNVYIPQSFSHEFMIFDECKNLFMVCLNGPWQSLEK
jgi:hypothetical protein